MATQQQYMSGEDRAEQEAAELAAAEREFNGEPQAPADILQDTPNEPANAPQESDVDWEKRYKDLQSYTDKQKNELQEKLREAGVEPDEADKVAEMEKQLQELRAKDEARETQDLVAQAQATVSAAHPDFVSVINSQEFAAWIKTQPQVYQDAIYADRPDATMSVDALTLYKVQSGHSDREAAKQHQQQLDQAALNVGGGHREAPVSQQEKVWSWNEIQSLTPLEYEKFEKEIDAALLEGRVR